MKKRKIISFVILAAVFFMAFPADSSAQYFVRKKPKKSTADQERQQEFKLDKSMLVPEENLFKNCTKEDLKFLKKIDQGFEELEKSAPALLEAEKGGKHERKHNSKRKVISEEAQEMLDFVNQPEAGEKISQAYARCWNIYKKEP